MDIAVTDQPEASRFEARNGKDLLGFVEYTTAPGVLTLTHTEIDKAYGGQGVGGTLIRGALDEIRARGLRVRPVCEFVVAFLGKNPGYQDLDVTAQEPGQDSSAQDSSGQDGSEQGGAN